jgi:hypothetical protein
MVQATMSAKMGGEFALRRKSQEMLSVENSPRNNGYTIKRVSSTGHMDDERTTAVGMERRLHKRRDKSRIENRTDLSEDEDSSGNPDMIPSFTSGESTELSTGSKKVEMLNVNRKSRVISSAQRETIAKEKLPPLPQPAPKSSKWVERLHAMAEQVSLPPHELDNFHISEESKNTSSDQITITQYAMPSPQHQTTRTEMLRKDRMRHHRLKMKSKPTSLARLDESRSSVDDYVLSSLPKPQLKRIQTAPTTMQSHRSSLVDDALTNRALSIREDLRQYEMQELAAEAERAAEEGLERFVGSASKFLMEDTRAPNNQHIGYHDDFVLAPHQLETPQRKNSACIRPGIDYTPSYFNKKKLRVTALREFSEVVPSFSEMHGNIRIHLRQRGVNPKVLPDEEYHKLVRKDTSQDANDDDINSQANVSQAGSVASFSSFAASLRGIVEYVGGNRSKHLSSNASRLASHHSTFDKYESLEEKPTNRYESYNESIGGKSSKRFDSCCGSFEFDSDPVVSKKKPSSQYEPIGRNVSTKGDSIINYESDDSSVELYGRMNTDGTSPSSVNGLLSGVGRDDKILRRGELFNDKTFDDEKSYAPSIISPSVISNDATQSVATFFSRIQHKFSRSPRDQDTASNSAQENRKFIANYFYTIHDASIINSEGISNLKLDINPDRKSHDGFCMSGCVQNDVLSSCETVGNMMDMILNWFGEKGNDSDHSTHSKSSSQIVLHHSWIRTWQTESNHKRFFMPPRLVAKR